MHMFRIFLYYVFLGSFPLISYIRKMSTDKKREGIFLQVWALAHGFVRIILVGCVWGGGESGLQPLHSLIWALDPPHALTYRDARPGSVWTLDTLRRNKLQEIKIIKMKRIIKHYISILMKTTLKYQR